MYSNQHATTGNLINQTPASQDLRSKGNSFGIVMGVIAYAGLVPVLGLLCVSAM